MTKSSLNLESQTDNITNIFTAQNVVMAHFFGEAPGVRGRSSNELSPIEDLRRVLEGREIPCSTVGIGDDRNRNNFFGRVGVILNPGQRSNITHSSSTDGGTLSPDEDGQARTMTNGRNDNSSIIAAIEERPIDEHNEIDVKGYKVVGLFYQPLDASDVAQPQPMQFNRLQGKTYSLTYLDFGREVPQLPCFLWTKACFFKVLWDAKSGSYNLAQCQRVNIADIYNNTPSQ